MHRLIVLQAADGSWGLTKELASIIGRELIELNAAVHGATGATGAPDEVLRAWATALALAWLEHTVADSEDEWRLLAKKARRWLDATKAVPPRGGGWVEAADGFLRVSIGD